MDNLVYHYTSLDALKGIIQSKICLWATRYDHLNDPHEQVWAKNVISDYCSQDPYINYKPTEHFEDWFAKYSYIISFCDIPDYRNMWRLYCNDGKGVCLSFDAEVLAAESQKNTNIDPQHSFDVFEKVYYSSKKTIKDAVEYWRQRGVFNLNHYEPIDELMNLCAFIKDDDFSIENELRYARIREISYIEALHNSQKEGCIEWKFFHDDNDVKYRNRGELEIVPYIEIQFPPNALKAITIGYQYKYEELEPYIRSILSSCGNSYKEVIIEPSKL